MQNLNFQERPLIQQAIVDGNIEKFRALTKNSEDWENQSETGRTVLHDACVVDNVEIAKICVEEYGISVHVKTEQNHHTPLHYCVIKKSMNCLE